MDTVRQEAGPTSKDALNKTAYSNVADARDLSRVDENELISQQKDSANNYMADRSDFETARKNETYGQDTPQLGPNQ